MKISKYSEFKRILILHGYGTNPNEGFYKNMKKRLSEIGHHVELPSLPNSNDPNDVIQSNSIKGQFDIVIGHSFGCVTGIRYAEKHKLESLILISGFIDTKFNKGDPDIESLKDASTWKFNFSKIKSNCEKIQILYPNKDTAVTLSQTKKLSTELGSKIIRFQEEEDHVCGSKEDDLIDLVSELIYSE
jgi:predicted alpha/beta hydrolase family esterase